jgi:outer membrane protein OmpA-like peptidoglycan-associated protein
VRTKRAAAAAAFAVLTVATACRRSGRMPMDVEVAADVPDAQAYMAGRALGTPPLHLETRSFSDLDQIEVRKGNQEPTEKRIRILSQSQAQVLFRFRVPTGSTAYQALGLTRALIFDYSEKVTFDAGKFDLKTEAKPILDRQAEILKTYFPKADIYVCGFTDTSGSYDMNMRLSLDRAGVVTDYLAGHGVRFWRLKMRGFGPQFPAVPNDTPENRALNRRTELILSQGTP